MNDNNYVPKLITWFKSNKRDLPWRHNRTFYRVWISEIMLQQTQVQTVIPYYLRFMERFPTVNDLANAPLDDVLKHWEGLGYYSRARNLHKGAQYLQNSLNSKFPESYEETIKIPGFGPYTTAAVLSFIYNKKHAVMDGNVIRVISRLTAVSDDMRHEKNKQLIQAIVNKDIPESNPAHFNEALMELGATICTPKNPQCTLCPIRDCCRAFSIKKVEMFPFKSKKPKVPIKTRDVTIFYFKNALLIEQRPTDQMLGGLWKFPDRVDNEGILLTQIKHTYSHFKLELNVFIQHERPVILNHQKWISFEEISSYAFDTASLKAIKIFLEKNKATV